MRATVIALLLATLGGWPLPARGQPAPAGGGRCLLTMRGHAGIVLCVTYLPHGDRLASAGRDKQVIIWDATTGKQLAALTQSGEGEAHAYSVSYSLEHRTLGPRPRGGGKQGADNYGLVFERLTLACCRSDFQKQTGEVVLWDAEAKKELKVLRGHTHAVNDVACSPDGTRVASGSYDSTVRVWDAGSGKELFNLQGHKQTVYVVTYDPAGRLLASGSADQKVILWDPATGKEVRTLAGHTGTVYGIAFSRDGRRVATSGDDQVIRVWDVATGQELLVLRGHAGSVSGVAFSPDGRLLASGSNDTTIKLWDARSGKELATLKGHTGMVRSVQFSPAKPRLASASWDQTVKVWDISGIKPPDEDR